MHWYLTIPFALGIFLSQYIGFEWEVELCLFVAGLLCMWLFYRKKQNVIPVLAVNSVLMGCLYCPLRQSVSEDSNDVAHLSSDSVFSSSGLSAEHQAVLKAMLLGNKSKLTKEQETMYRDAGASHLLALSGTHLGILLAILGVLMLPSVRFSRWRWVALAVILSLLWLYAFMVGLPKSLLRASLMATLFLLGKFSLRPTRGYEILGTAVLVMLLADPLCAFDIGAQLSVTALVGITCFYPALNGLLPDNQQIYYSFPMFGRKLRERLSWLQRKGCALFRFFFISLSAWLFTMPLVAYYFHQFQLWSPLSGMLIIPLTSLVLYGGVVLLLLSFFSVGVAASFSVLLDGLMDVQESVLQFFAGLPMSCVKLPDVSLWHVALLYLLFAELWVLLRHRSWKVLALATLSCVFTMTFFVFL